ncbi:TonB-dependent receptor [Wenzhouxiangella sp. AB-CW3]|nr:TonB-dependent receptor [Wenzhouxiangella sp. AB-CW3]
MQLMCGVALAVFANVNMSAQEAGEDEPRESESAPEALETIVVTGSRLRRTGFDAPTPTISVEAEEIEAAGIVNVADIINELPQIATGFSNENTSFSFGNIGLNQVNLRNLGVRRTLTLVNGRRRAGTPDDSNFLAFDLSNIPTALIERVEVQTGGTSAVYGADAVAGVVNIILRDDFEGLETFGQYGITGAGDYDTSMFGLTAGANYDRGNAVFHVSRSENDRLTRADRDLGASFAFVSNPENTGPDDGIPARIPLRDLRFAYFGIPTPTAFLPFGSDGEFTDVIFDSSLQTFRPIEAGPRGVIDGSYSQVEGGTQGPDTLVAPLERTTIFGSANYELRPNLDFFAEGTFSDSSAEDRIGPVFDSFSTFVSVDNPYMPEQVREGLLAEGLDEFSYARQHDEFGMRGADINRKYYSVAVGFEGSVVDDWTWSAAYEFGQSNTTNRNLNDRIDERWFEASDAIRDPDTNKIVCRSAKARARGCVPVNIFGEGTISQEAVDYIRVDHTTTTETTQNVFQTLVAGELFEVPAGAAQLSAGLEYRKDALDFRPSSVWKGAQGFFASQFSPVRESNDVREAFAEVLVPLVVDRPLIQALEVEGAYRRSDYQRAGGVDSWKLAGSWAPVDDVRFRVTRARAVRAPSLGELFDPGSRGAAGLSDPCDPLLLDSGSESRRSNCAALGLDPDTFNPDTRRVTTLVFTTGNPDLDVEVGDTWTIGAVAQPRFAPGLSISADWYSIDLGGGIARVGAQQILNNCVDLPSLDNQFCDFVTRQPDGNIGEVRDSYINASAFEVEGVDMEVSYQFDGADLFRVDREVGSFNLRGISSYLMKNRFIERDLVSGEETPFENAGLSGNPEFQFIANIGYEFRRFNLTWQSRYVGGTVTSNIVENPQEDVGEWFNIPSIWYHDLSAGYNLTDDLRVYGGVNNVFDTGPRGHPFTARGNQVHDNLIGRFVFAGVRARF